MDNHRFGQLSVAVPTRRLSRRTLAQTSVGLAAGALAVGQFGRVAAAQEAAATPEPPAWEAVDQLMAAAAPETALLAAELVDGLCQTVHAFNAEAILPVGSSFKLWILGALALEIQAGRLAWEQPVGLEDRYRSVPGGDLRYALPGTRYTVRYLAERMMQKSDNTATDHVLFLVGREKVEATMAAMGVADPARNIPLISTRDLAMMKFALTTDQLDAYYAAPVAERRRILAEVIAAIPYEALADLDQTAPLEIDRVEWFASREDLCHTMAWLHAKAAEPGMLPVTEVMALETQLPFNGEVWPYAGFKGGSELGVLSGTWLLQRADGRHFVYSVGFKNPAGEIDLAAAVAAMEAGRDRLALTP